MAESVPQFLPPPPSSLSHIATPSSPSLTRLLWISVWWQSECTFQEAMEFTRGRAIFASGSAFPPLTIDGTTLIPGQANNCYILSVHSLMRPAASVCFSFCH